MPEFRATATLLDLAARADGGWAPLDAILARDHGDLCPLVRAGRDGAEIVLGVSADDERRAAQLTSAVVSSVLRRAGLQMSYRISVERRPRPVTGSTCPP